MFQPNDINESQFVGISTRNYEFHEVGILYGNSKIMLTQNSFDLFSDLEKHEENSKYKLLTLKPFLSELDTHFWPFMLQLKDPLVLKYLLYSRGKKIRKAGKCQIAMRSLEAAKIIHYKEPALDIMIYRELAACYEAMGQYCKTRQLAEMFLDDMKQSGASGIYDKVSYFVPFPFWQGEVEYSVDSWEVDLFGSNNSRALSSSTSPDGFLVATRDFAVGDVVFIERPIVGTVAESKGQCNVCTLKTMYSIPCADCCAVFYCSVDCRKKDTHFHQYECRGFKILLFPLLNGVLPLRLLVKALDILNSQLDFCPPDKYPGKVSELWATLVKGCEQIENFKFLLRNGYDYRDNSKAVLQPLLIKTRTILHYVIYASGIVEHYERCWTNVSPKAREMFLGGLLLRFLVQTMLKSSCFTYELVYDTNQKESEKTGALDTSCNATYSASTRKLILIPSLAAFAKKYCSGQCVDTDASFKAVKDTLESALSEMVQKFATKNVADTVKDHTSSTKKVETKGSLGESIPPQGAVDPSGCARIRQNLDMFWNKCVQTAANDQDQETGLVRTAWSHYARTYHLFFGCYDAQLIAYKKSKNQYCGMYRFSFDMQQTCFPNTVAILLNDGAVAFRALKPIKKGQALTFAKDKSCGNCDNCREESIYFPANFNLLRCAKCRFQLGKSLGSCDCKGTSSTNETAHLIMQLKTIEYSMVYTKGEKLDYRKALRSMTFFDKLWKSIFLGEYNKLSYMNAKHQLFLWAGYGIKGLEDTESMEKALNTILHIIDTAHGLTLGWKYRETICTLRQAIKISHHYMVWLSTNVRPQFTSHCAYILTTADRLLALCRQSKTTFESEMKHEYLIELLRLNNMLRQIRSIIFELLGLHVKELCS